MHAGLWDKAAEGSHEVRGRTLGIVGYGNIGTQLSVLAESLGMTVYFYDTADKLALGNARRCATLDELLEVADVVTLHVDGRPATAASSARSSSPGCAGSLFLNLSRGSSSTTARCAATSSGAPRRRGGRRLPGRAEGPRRRVRVRAARAAQRHPHPPHRRVH
jgi:phosphoglycerate dehydrogenase-like enzyme